MKEPDDEAFRDFMIARSPRYLRTAYLLTGNWNDAEDLLQSTLAKVYRHWNRLRDQDSLDAYVRKAMVHTRTSWWRRAWKAEYPTAVLPDTAGRDEFGNSDERDRLRRALATLPERQRAAVVLRHYDDLPESEVASVLGCSVGTVKSQCHRGLAKLRELLDAPDYEAAYTLEGGRP